MKVFSLWFIFCLFSFLLIFLSVGFVTLLERKILGLSQLRFGVNKTGFVGVFQALLDAMKLLSKEFFVPLKAPLLWFCFSPVILFIFCCSFWNFLFDYCSMSSSLFILFFLSILSLTILPTITSGWMSGSKYPLLGTLRSVSQVFSFELCFSLLLFLTQQKGFVFLSFFNPLFWLFFFFWLCFSLIETMRCPFDLSESESELVSGLNSEHLSFSFVFLFLSEYSSILFFSSLVSFFLFNNSLFFSSLFCFLILISRSTFVRVKIDQVMSLLWFSFLPILVFLFFFLLL